MLDKAYIKNLQCQKHVIIKKTNYIYQRFIENT